MIFWLSFYFIACKLFVIVNVLSSTTDFVRVHWFGDSYINLMRQLGVSMHLCGLTRYFWFIEFLTIFPIFAGNPET
jgi:hypothetical protein